MYKVKYGKGEREKEGGKWNTNEVSERIWKTKNDSKN